ncbi:MAG: 6-phosphofructokinase [Firmicutes bacterium]|nr:6-phosphofructokinase [Bacillota bacterium]
MKTIGVLTSGGDAPGMNAAIRAVVRYGIHLGMTVYGVERGFAGLIEGKFNHMQLRSVADIIHRGGTILKTARCEDFKTKAGQEKGVAQLKNHGIEGLIVIGGDGSFMGARALSNLGFPAVGIPGTIDNDLGYTDYTLGFDTACNTVLNAVNNLRDTMTSHERVSIIEVMGRNCGDIALYSGLCGGAEIIMIPENPPDLDEICEKMLASKQRGKLSGIIVLAEGAGRADEVSAQIAARTGMSCRSTVLGHIQRGGNPGMQDRYLGTNFGVYAVKLLQQGIGNRIIGIKNGQFFDMDIIEGCAVKRKFNKQLYDMAEVVAK